MKNRILYAGIGSREVPEYYYKLIRTLSEALDPTHFLRSGGARGCDRAFANGSTHKDIIRPDDATPEAIAYAAQFRSNFDTYTPEVQQLFGRNAMIILGRDLRTPVSRVICWTPEALLAGGTGHALRIAQKNNIPITNLGDPATVRDILARGILSLTV